VARPFDRQRPSQVLERRPGGVGVETGVGPGTEQDQLAARAGRDQRPRRDRAGGDPGLLERRLKAQRAKRRAGVVNQCVDRRVGIDPGARCVLVEQDPGRDFRDVSAKAAQRRDQLDGAAAQRHPVPLEQVIAKQGHQRRQATARGGRIAATRGRRPR